MPEGCVWPQYTCWKSKSFKDQHFLFAWPSVLAISNSVAAFLIRIISCHLTLSLKMLILLCTAASGLFLVVARTHTNYLWEPGPQVLVNVS